MVFEGGSALGAAETKAKVIVLADFFSVNPFPSQSEKEELARATALTYKQVTAWFQNQRKKNGMTNLNNLPRDRLQVWHHHVAEHIRVAQERRSTNRPSASGSEADTADGKGTIALPPLPPMSENQIALPTRNGVAETALIKALWRLLWTTMIGLRKMIISNPPPTFMFPGLMTAGVHSSLSYSSPMAYPGMNGYRYPSSIGETGATSSSTPPLW
ncbi:hypothetical protein M427DRAFT_32281 [Gonapodya prolifera JEL478]|uniref:Homeobox domain-containing protein n=1 Tax=Gonapodya prolifera (strain JEL478) TaxID=1344416 RepID=A0A139AFL8_GONPJ|nr:hypothetical protein M427DRAFT_32281 [Gonapodya prolifera JEL478]|eukprot:KXS15596.1 hypothetical protein M427DRAFT_32281 [Gonapodya prolifera JEL478]